MTARKQAIKEAEALMRAAFTLFYDSCKTEPTRYSQALQPMEDLINTSQREMRDLLAVIACSLEDTFALGQRSGPPA